jgi:putative acetyltransferase
VRIEVDDISRPQVVALIEEHLASARELSPPGMTFAFDASKLKAPGVTFWTIWEGDVLLGCGALKELSSMQGEVKSMRTPARLRRKGAGLAMLAHIIATARTRGYEALHLETGANPAFIPAQRLYESFGFKYSGPFAHYVENGNSVFMSLTLHEPSTPPSPSAA